MGFREVVLFGFVLLLSGGSLSAATQNVTTNETLHQIPQEQLRSAQSNKTSDPVRVPASYRLRTFQLREPLVENLQRSRGPTVSAQEPPVHGPDLNPPAEQGSKVLVEFKQRAPVSAASVAVRCGEKEVTVEVKQDFLGNGQLIRPSDLTLGGCATLHAADRILQFQTELQGCGSRLTMTEDAVIYSFSLMYSPKPIGNTVILKTNPAETAIQCHYRRRHHVSSNAVRPSWKPFASSMLAERQLRFSLHLMTEDWQAQRPSSVYFLSDVMHVEAAVLQGHHLPLRVYVDSCLATVSPDPSSEPRYPFIHNHGCFSDAKLTGAKSFFMPRSHEDKLHFQLKAFRFQDHRNSLYITCRLKATTVSVPFDPQHKACSFLTEANRWVASGGDNKVCSCCESSCSEQRRRRRLAADADLQWEATAALGPILVEEEPAKLHAEPLPQTPHEATRGAADSPAALLGGASCADANPPDTQFALDLRQ